MVSWRLIGKLDGDFPVRSHVWIITSSNRRRNFYAAIGSCCRTLSYTLPMLEHNPQTNTPEHNLLRHNQQHSIAPGSMRYISIADMTFWVKDTTWGVVIINDVIVYCLVISDVTVGYVMLANWQSGIYAAFLWRHIGVLRSDWYTRVFVTISVEI